MVSGETKSLISVYVNTWECVRLFGDVNSNIYNSNIKKKKNQKWSEYGVCKCMGDGKLSMIFTAVYKLKLGQ